MRFRLFYQGLLLGATQSNTRAQHKHAIRRALDPQFRAIWKNHLHLYGVPMAGTANLDDYPSSPMVLGNKYQIGGYRCVPMVMESDNVSVEISVLLLRPGPLGVILPNTGDVDNRLATIFDALQMPSPGMQWDGTKEPDPMVYCLLENDKLITKVTIEADTLLGPVYRRDKGATGELSSDANNALAVLTIDIASVGKNSFLARF